MQPLCPQAQGARVLTYAVGWLLALRVWWWLEHHAGLLLPAAPWPAQFELAHELPAASCSVRQVREWLAGKEATLLSAACKQGQSKCCAHVWVWLMSCVRLAKVYITHGAG